jgi:REP element-mobilizing transposase RayT
LSSYVQVLYQIVFCTKYRRKVLTKPGRVKLYKYIHGICTQRRCILYEINGVEDHTHLIMRVHPSVAISDLVKEVKAASSRWIKRERLFPDFECWQPGYAAFSYAPEALPNLRRYVRQQEIHHAAEGSKAELIRLLEERGVDYDPRYLE